DHRMRAAARVLVVAQVYEAVRARRDLEALAAKDHLGFRAERAAAIEAAHPAAAARRLCRRALERAPRGELRRRGERAREPRVARQLGLLEPEQAEHERLARAPDALEDLRGHLGRGGFEISTICAVAGSASS